MRGALQGATIHGGHAGNIDEILVGDTPPIVVDPPPVYCQIRSDSPPPVVNEPTELTTFCVREYCTFTVQKAWDHGNIAQYHQPLGTREEFQFLWPMLTCRNCCFLHGAPYIQIGSDDYISSMTNTTNWYDSVFIALFAQLAVHYAHITYDKCHSSLPLPVNLPLLIHIRYPKETLLEGQYKALPPGMTRVVAVLHKAAHHAVLEIDIHNKKVHVYDGLYRDLNKWLDYVFSAMKHCMLCDTEAAHLCEADKPKLMKFGVSRHTRMSIEGYKLTVGIHEWRFERGHFIKQVDLFNCGPIACTKILEMFHLTSTYEVKLAYDTNSICNLVTENWRHFVHRCDQDLLVRVREHLPLHTPTAEEGNLVLLLQNTASTAPISDPVIAGAVAVSAQAEIDHHQLCFCYCDSPDMELVRMKCCKQTIH